MDKTLKRQSLGINILKYVYSFRDIINFGNIMGTYLFDGKNIIDVGNNYYCENIPEYFHPLKHNVPITYWKGLVDKDMIYKLKISDIRNELLNNVSYNEYLLYYLYGLNNIIFIMLFL